MDEQETPKQAQITSLFTMAIMSLIGIVMAGAFAFYSVKLSYNYTGSNRLVPLLTDTQKPSVTLAGTLVCLPASVYQQRLLEPACITGLQATDGNYYQLFALESNFDYLLSKQVIVHGMITTPSLDSENQQSTVPVVLVRNIALSEATPSAQPTTDD